ncbi:cupin domain-containing protein [Skermania sp. ID1734]|uniref:cupin domain-containing protein n=1 Tax=Skermania sp. ID1734 TaxID=2597516 RepID=UPI001180770C|nr:cupin domain-containing protein [Skermania sp. ID1734]TSD99436.1 cupin domain-containing protein [Skermania sp. ID1734]
MNAQLPAWADSLDLRPHPEGGWFRETWRSDIDIEPVGYPGVRSAGTAILFLLLPGEESAWHSVRGAELWFHHRGGPLRLGIGGDAPHPGEPSHVRLGADVAAGEQPQILIPPGHWQRAVNDGAHPCLVSCVVVPGFDFDDFTLARGDD